MGESAERWALVQRFPDYIVSTWGEVRRIEYLRTIAWAKGPSGRYTVTLWHRNRSTTVQVHRLVAETFLNDYDPTLEVIHLTKYKNDNSIENIAMGTKRIRSTSPEPLVQKTRYQVSRPTKKVRLVEENRVFVSAAKAAAHVSGRETSVRNVLNGTRATYKGLHFEYVEEE